MKYKTLKDDQCILIVPPNIQALMSGVRAAKQNREGVVKLCYTDGTEEMVSLPDFDISQADNFFSIVSAVQDKRHPIET